MELYQDIDLQDCPLCHGPGMIEEENGWCLYVGASMILTPDERTDMQLLETLKAFFLDLGFAGLTFSTPEERLAAAKQAARFWNVGKVIHTGVGD